MTTASLDRVKQTFGFFSMTIAWASMNVLFAIYLACTYGTVVDSGPMISWSALILTITWVIFINLPLENLDHSKRFFKPTIFPYITGLYVALTYLILVGGLFRSIELLATFLPLAFIAGAIFGISYSLLIRSGYLIALLIRKPFTKAIFILSPVMIVFFFLWMMQQLRFH